MNPRNLGAMFAVKAGAFAPTTLTAGATIVANLEILDQSSTLIRPRPHGLLAAFRVDPTIAGGKAGTIKCDVIHDDVAIDSASEVLKAGVSVALAPATEAFNINVSADMSAAKAFVGVRITTTFTNTDTDTIVVNGALALGGFDGEFDVATLLAQL